MENDDLPIGTILSRRDALKLIGITGAALLASCIPGSSEVTQTGGAQTQVSSTAATGAVPACVVRPEITEGPYYVDEDLNLSDVRSDPTTGEVKAGALLTLAFLVSQVGNGSCTPLEGAKVEIWHCDADGVYSGVSDPGFDTTGQKFLRGYQVTDVNGQAMFVTIYPGWYSSRTVHIHFKVHDDTTDQSRVFTSQLFFDDSLTDQVFSQEPYARQGQRDTLHSNDNIYDDQLLLTVEQTGEGYTATFDIGFQST
jgi:protocatechuate 3,4-dioxygenase beta subunit